MTPLQAAWLAAVIDCEGTICVSASLRHRGHPFDLYAIAFVAVSQNDRRLLERCVEVSGVGHISNPIVTPINGNLNYQWRLKGSGPLKKVLKATVRYMIVKRQRALDLVECLEKYEKLLKQPLIDLDAARRYQKTDKPKRLRVANRGHADFVRILLPWMEKHQPGTKSLALCKREIEKLDDAEDAA